MEDRVSHVHFDIRSKVLVKALAWTAIALFNLQGLLDFKFKIELAFVFVGLGGNDRGGAPINGLFAELFMRRYTRVMPIFSSHSIAMLLAPR